MGRALLIICAGVFVGLGYVSIGINSQTRSVTESTVSYAQVIQARNAAHTAIQVGMNEMNKDTSFANTHGESNKWKPIIDGDTAEVYFDVIQGTNGYRDTSIVRVHATAKSGGYKSKVISLYRRSNFDFVPTFTAAAAFATNNFTFSMGGSSQINGNAPSGSDCQDLPGIATMTDERTDYVEGQTSGSSNLTGNPEVQTDPDLSYSPVDSLIARLRDLEGTQFISGNYKGGLGTQDEPGVFFVEDYAKFTGGIGEGYGILVVRSDADMEYEDSDGSTLDMAGNVTFNGLVIFENAYNFDGKGTPTINGSVLVGNTDDYSGTIDVDISGNLTIQYDCVGEEYAKLAAARMVQTNKYKRLTTFEDL
ncbi:hypothetical protein NC796_06885 [Aliifodinibius sp. S!AR15-10]|uniref:hypothetical protein n=1 Tax=Aliifodinibius sp. S!AR15-10 TaxID=2950437 RepID=UPI0028671A2C|nr:hypothetical protein [Aliifodinibius sp. S!AR15-10]MDR8390854.1 hypothetical protein [Aliifodinibius sp. S!AR15-10]